MSIWWVLAVVVVILVYILLPKTPTQKEYLVRVEGSIVKVIEDDTQGDRHQRMFVKVSAVKENKESAPIRVGEELFVAMRYGDREGFPVRLTALDHAQGRLITIQGRYVPEKQAGPGRRSVLHFTHKPVGFIIFNGKRYE